VCAKERIERLVEDRQVVAPMHEQRPQHGADIGAATQPDPLERANGVEQARMMHVETRRAKDAAEEQYVGQE
jgi:hypothetical protein